MPRGGHQASRGGRGGGHQRGRGARGGSGSNSSKAQRGGSQQHCQQGQHGGRGGSVGRGSRGSRGGPSHASYSSSTSIRPSSSDGGVAAAQAAVSQPSKSSAEFEKANPLPLLVNKYLKDPKPPLIGGSQQAALFLQQCAQYHQTYVLCQQLCSSKFFGRQRLLEAMGGTRTSAFLNSAILPFLGSLGRDLQAGSSLGDLKYILAELILSVLDIAGLLRFVIESAESGSLSETGLQHLRTFVVLVHRVLESRQLVPFDSFFSRLFTYFNDPVLELMAGRDSGLTSSKAAEASASSASFSSASSSSSGSASEEKGYVFHSQHQNDFEDYRRISIIPTPDEMLCSLPYFPARQDPSPQECAERERNATSSININSDQPPTPIEPMLPQEAAFHRAALDRLFRLQREDLVGSMRESLQVGQIRSTRFTVASFNGIHADLPPRNGRTNTASLLVTLQFPPRHEYCGLPDNLHIRENYLRDGRGRRLLSEDGIICIRRRNINDQARAGSISAESIVGLLSVRFRNLAPVRQDKFDPDQHEQQHRELQLRMVPRKDQNKSATRNTVVIGLGLPEGADDAGERMINLWKELQSFSIDELEVFTVPSNLISVQPVLRRLQLMSKIPFATEFLYCKPHIYANIYRGSSLVLPLQNFGDLDDTQIAAVRSSISQRVSLIQGPPGTGKTHTGVFIAKHFVKQMGMQLLVMCYTNHALDQFMERLLDSGLTSFCRLGGGCGSERIKPFTLSHLTRSVPRGQRAATYSRDWYQQKRRNDLKDSRREMLRRIRELEDLLKRRSKQAPVWDELSQCLDDSLLRQFRAKSAEDADGFAQVDAGGKKKREDHLLQSWRKGSHMTPKLMGELAAAITRSELSLWMLDKDGRRELLDKWNEEFFLHPIRSDIAHELTKLEGVDNELASIQRRQDVDHLRSATVIGCTTTGAAIYKELLDQVRPRVLLLEEAAEILETQVVAALDSCFGGPVERDGFVIMIGDHQQLRPKVDVYKLSVASGQGFDLNRSLFERLVLSGYPVVTLRQQHRMRPELSRIMRSVTYPNLEDAQRVLTLPTSLRGVKAGPLIFINHHINEDAFNRDSSRSVEDPTSMSKSNAFEVDMVVQITKHLLAQGYQPKQIVVLTPYLGQLEKIKKAFERITLSVDLSDRDDDDLDAFDQNRGDAPGLQQAVQGPGAVAVAPNLQQIQLRGSIRVATVDNFQGEESDIIIASLVRGNDHGLIGFLWEPERINVLFSRARFGMIVLGNLETMLRSRRQGQLWPRMRQLLQDGGAVFDGFPVVCSQHHADAPAVILDSVAAFKLHSPEGGCQQMCGVPLPLCGHTCPLYCHPIDRQHTQVKCTHVQSETCPNGHRFDYRCDGTGQPRQVGSGCTVCAELARIEQRRIQEAENTAKARHDLEQQLMVVEAQREQARKEFESALQLAQRERELKLAERRTAIERATQESLLAVRQNTREDELTAAVLQLEAEAAMQVQIAEVELHDELLRLQQDFDVKQQQLEADKRSALGNITAMMRRCEQAHRQMLDKLQRQQQALVDEATARAFAERVSTCLVCGDDAKLALGICCGALPDVGGADDEEKKAAPPPQQAHHQAHHEGADFHFICNECLAQQITSVTDPAQPPPNRGYIRCSIPECRRIFSFDELCLHVDPPVLQRVIACQVRVAEARLAVEFEEKQRAEIDRLMKLSADQLAVEQAVKHLREEIMTLKCPRCRAAFLDFDGCCALTCARGDCGCGFCAFCLADCGGDAHAHVAGCQLNPSRQRMVFCDFATFQQSQRERRTRMCREYIERGVAAHLRQQVTAQIERDLRDL